MFLVGAPFMAPGICALKQGAMNRAPTVILCLFLLLALSGCKIELNIFGNDEDDKVISESGNFDCSNNTTPNSPDNGDCSQQYVANITDCVGYGVNGNDTWAELPNCTELPTTGYEETLVAVPDEGNDFDGWGNFCAPGSGFCQMTIEGDAEVTTDAVVEATFGGATALEDATYTYNHKGQRASKTVDGVTLYFIYDLAGNLIGEYDNSGEPLREYVYIEGKLLAQYDYVPSATEPEQHYYFNDHLGTPVYMFNRDMDPSYELATGPFSEGYGEFKLAGMVQPVRFPGQYGDGESGYNYNWNRDYDPSTGRYLQSDPIGLAGGINTYGYVYQNPVMNIDPMGLDTVVNKSGSSVVVRGNAGSGHGSGKQQYGAVPSDGAVHGGSTNPIPSWSDPANAEKARKDPNDPSLPPPDGHIEDVDGYICPIDGDQRLRGDAQGPETTLGSDKDGRVVPTKRDGVTSSVIRYFLR